MRPVLLAFVLLCGCEGLRARSDGGSAGDGEGGGSAAAGGGASGSGGGSAGSGGGSGLRAFTWGKMSAPSAAGYQGIWGKGEGSSVVLYVAQHSSRIARFANHQWATVYSDPFNTNFVSVWVSPNEEVFAVGQQSASSCTGSCSAQASWSQFTVPQITFSSVCGSDLQHVYAVGDLTVKSGLMKFNPSNAHWDWVSMDTGSNTNASCWVAPNGDVYIAAHSAIVRYDGNTFFNETIAWPASYSSNDIASAFFNGVAGGASGIFAAGDGKRVVFRDSPGHWKLVYDPASAEKFWAIAADTTGAVAVGTTQGGSSEPIFALGDSASWRWDSNAPSNLSAWSAWSASPNEIYVSGYENGGGAIYMGTR